jgi:hypothetical protein
MPTQQDRRERDSGGPPLHAAEQEDLRDAHRAHARRVRRARANLIAWAVGTVLITVLWAAVEWDANGAFESFGHEGRDGEWNPTLWALAIGIWGLVAGIVALRARFERPPTEAEIDAAVARVAPSAAAPAALRAFARRRLEGVRRLRFHLAAWVLGVVVVAPLNVLVEWQDNGGFERLSGDSQPGSWDPWGLYIAGIWALVIAALAAAVYTRRP